MKRTINFRQFEQAFKYMGRENQFPEGLSALFDYLESYEQDTDSELELDVIALCCDFTECKLSEALNNYSLDSIDDLRDNTIVIMVGSENDEDPTIIYQNY